MGGQRGEAVVGEDLNDAFVEEDAQIETFGRRQCERDFCLTHGQHFCLWLKRDGKAVFAILVAIGMDPELPGRARLEGDAQLECVAGDVFEPVGSVRHDPHFACRCRLTAQLLQFPERLDAQHSVRWQAQLARQALDAALDGHVLEPVLDPRPGPHHASAIRSQQALGSVDVSVFVAPLECAHPVHPAMRFREKFFVLKAAEVVAAPDPVTQAEQHPLVPDPEHIRAGDVFIARHVEGGHFVVEQAPEVIPFPQIRGLHQVRILAPGDSVVGFSIEPAVRVPVTHFRKRSRLRLRVHRHRFRPALQQVVLGESDLIAAGTFAVIDDRRLAFPGEEAGSAEQIVPHRRRGESGRMPLPMHHVGAGNVCPRDACFGLVDVVEMVSPLPVETGIRVARRRCSRVGQMIRQPRRRGIRREGGRLLLWLGRGWRGFDGEGDRGGEENP